MPKKALIYLQICAVTMLLTACLDGGTPTVAPPVSDPSYPAPPGGLPTDLAYPPPAGNQIVGSSYPAPGEESVTRVSDVLANPANFTSVTLQGEIMEQIDGENYLFRDVSGSIRVKIDPGVAWDDTLNKTVVVLGDVEMDDDLVLVVVRSIDGV